MTSPPAFGTHAPKGLARILTGLASHVPFNRGRLRVATAHALLGLMGGTADVTFRGGRFRIHRDRSPIEYGMLLYPAYNAPELDFLLGGLKPGDVAVDLGANIGMFTITMAACVGDSGRVIAVDPSEPFMAKLRINAAVSGLSNIVFENVAVGGHEGNARLNAVEGNPGTATVSEVASGGIRMRPLVAILADNGVTAIAAMKVDIDGFEEKALGPFFREAADGLLPVRVVVETVLLTDETATFVKTMLDRGYVKTGQTRSNALFERRA
ncbi:MAG: FkbM family methyltransferase [Paracoccaceae bacterium]